MTTILAACGVDGCLESLRLLENVIDERRPDVLLFAGGIFQCAATSGERNGSLKRNAIESVLLNSLLSPNRLGCSALAVIPGPEDGPLRSFIREGFLAEARQSGVRVVHGAVMTVNSRLAISGFAGELTPIRDACEPIICCSRATADYLLQSFLAAPQLQKVLLFATPPTGRLGGKSGNRFIRDLIEAYAPQLCVTAGTTALRGHERAGNTLIVNPGRISDGSAAWIDLNCEMAKQVELLDLHPKNRRPVRRTKSGRAIICPNLRSTALEAIPVIRPGLLTKHPRNCAEVGLAFRSSLARRAKRTTASV